MTMTATPSVNGRKDRRSLSNEIDRFDRMIDGLDKAIPDAVSDAIKEAIAPAVAEALRATLTELASNPEILVLLQNLRGSAVGRERKPSALQRLRRSLTSFTNRVRVGVTSTVSRLTSPVRRVVGGGVDTCRQINSVWSLRKPVAVALGIGALIGVSAYVSAPWLAGVLAGGGAACTTLLGQFAVWARRLMAGLVA